MNGIKCIVVDDVGFVHGCSVHDFFLCEYARLCSVVSILPVTNKNKGVWFGMARIDMVSPQGVSHGTPPQVKGSEKKPANGFLLQFSDFLGSTPPSSILRLVALLACVAEAAVRCH